MSEPYSIAIITGSPTQSSRSAAVAATVSKHLVHQGFRTRTIHVRDLPAQALLHADPSDPQVAEALELVDKADGVVIASPTYKAAYTGILKAFLDLLPQFGLRRKVVLPLLTGGSLAHVLALDYGLRPVLQSFDPQQVVSGIFLLDKWVARTDDGFAELDAEIKPRFDATTQPFVESVRALITE
jgi:FMN reductase